jgi:MraZ protein
LTVEDRGTTVARSGAKGRGPGTTERDRAEWRVATRFVGRHEHSLDVKGRIILPARYRSSFDTLAYISKNTERCLALWTPEAFERKLDEMEALFDRSPEDRAMVRAWSSGSTEVEMDRQGRVAIPSYLREYAHLEDAVLIHGAISHIELWDPEEWTIRGAPGDAELADPTRTVFALTASSRPAQAGQPGPSGPPAPSDQPRPSGG